jgi:hypothetical protein
VELSENVTPNLKVLKASLAILWSGESAGALPVQHQWSQLLPMLSGDLQAMKVSCPINMSRHANQSLIHHQWKSREQEVVWLERREAADLGARCWQGKS